MQKPGNAPQDAQRLDRARAFDSAHVGDVEPELIAGCVVTSLFAPSSLPQMNIVGFSPLKSGLTMNALPTQLNAFTKFAVGRSCLQPLHQRFVLRREVLQHAVDRRRHRRSGWSYR